MKIMSFCFQKVIVVIIVTILLPLTGMLLFSTKVMAQEMTGVAPVSITYPLETTGTAPVNITKPSITSFTTETSSEYGGSMKMTWQTDASTYVDYFSKGYGIGLVDAKTGVLAGGNLPASGVLYLKVINGTRNDSVAEIYMTPYYKDDSSFRVGLQRSLSFNVNGSTVSPIIKKLEPENITKNTILTLHGTGFVAKGNNIEIMKVGYGVKELTADSSDGVTLKIQIPNTLDFSSEEIRGVQERDTIPGLYQIVVDNDSGKSDVVKFHIIEAEKQMVESPTGSTSNIESKSPIPSNPTEKIAPIPLTSKSAQPLIAKPTPSSTPLQVTEKITQNDAKIIEPLKSLWARFLSFLHF